MRRLDVDSHEIVRLYVEERLSGPKISKLVDVGEHIVYRVLEEAGVKRSSRAPLPTEEIVRLYVQEGWPQYKIAERFGVANVTVARHLQEAGVQLRTPVEARQPPGRRPCPQSKVFRAYLLGLVWGDFSVRRHGDSGQTLSVGSSTTDPHQVKLIHGVFGPFGPVYDWAGKTFRASLDLSFAFLSTKYDETVPDWIRGAEPEAAFVAGYVDAEGSFGVYSGRARFKLDSYDRDVLHWIHRWCGRNGVRSRLLCVATAGSPRPDQGEFRSDLWRVNVNEALGILRFIATLEPYLRHGGRMAAASRARANVLTRTRSRLGDQLEPLPFLAGAHRPREIDAC